MHRPVFDTYAPPPRLSGKDFEKLCIYRMEREESAGVATMSRCGVQASRFEDKWMPIQSLPDFEGVLMGGRQFVIEAKVCSIASFPLNDDKFKARQLRHLRTRGQFGSVSILLIHFNERHLAKQIQAAVTYAFPVHPDHDFWRAVDRKETRAISRMDCEQYAVSVRWGPMPGCRKESPDLVGAIVELSETHTGETL